MDNWKHDDPVSLSHLLTKITTMIEENHEQINDHEKRLRLLEKGLAYGSGAVGMGLFVLKVFKVI